MTKLLLLIIQYSYVAVKYVKSTLLRILSYNQTCKELAKPSNRYSSGDYILMLSAEAIRTVYCDITSTLGDYTSGWMRIVKLYVNNCPQGFNTTIHTFVNTCIRSESIAGCTRFITPPAMFDTATSLEQLELWELEHWMVSIMLTVIPSGRTVLILTVNTLMEFLFALTINMFGHLLLIVSVMRILIIIIIILISINLLEIITLVIILNFRYMWMSKQ